ncbi:autotransporter domain-containing protein [Pseudomonas chlororaphis]|uniref:autotransporter domain-containing protein n=1 Tax=Pseudomonas chlororaphis TaxID=587753 RepID=UPI0023684048|nr:autotransporter domain-containing protein [Pseudomonas chlororaphis]WDH90646.1 autotransporter domain-containing protein [Pseudomonas chlororaphis]
MNHVYRIVFNRGLGLWQVVGEHARKQGKQAGRTGGRRRGISRRASGTLPALALISLFIPGVAQTAFAQAPLVEGSGDIAPTLPTGPLTQWHTDQQLIVGDTGFGKLDISNGGRVVNTSGASIGNAASGVGEVSVSGKDSWWSNTEDLYVGVAGSGSLTIKDGGKVVNMHDVSIGNAAGSVGKVSVSGKDSLLTSHDVLRVGVAGSGSLTIKDGGTVFSTYSSIGDGPEGQGAVTVSNGALQNSADVFVGKQGKGALTVEDGGQVTSYRSFIGQAQGSTGTAIVSGQDSLWSNKSLFVGYGGSGSLSIRDGGKVTNTNGILGSAAGSQGEVLVSGPGALWENKEGVSIGDLGEGTLRIENGGTVSSQPGDIGRAVGSVGRVSVTGPGSLWNINRIDNWWGEGRLNVGNAGTGTLEIKDGGKVTGGNIHIGSGAQGDGSVTVSTGGRLVLRENLVVGAGGTSKLSIENGGVVESFRGIVGDHRTKGKGTVSVSGPGSTWTTSSSLSIGSDYAGGNEGTLTIDNEGKVFSEGAVAIGGKKGTGTVHVTRKGALSASLLLVGLPPGDSAPDGNSSLTIDSGGKVETREALVNANQQAAEVTVTGKNSIWSVTQLNVGLVGSGIVNVVNGGTLSAGLIKLVRKFEDLDQLRSLDQPGHGTINIGSAAGEAAASAGILDAKRIEFGSDEANLGTGILNFNHTDTNFVLGAELVSVGTVMHQLNQLSGFTRLTGDNAGFFGLTTVAGGTLIAADRISGAARVTGGTLQFGDGNSGRLSQLGGDLSVSGAGSTLAVKGPATLDLAYDLAMADQTVLSITADAQEPAVQAQHMSLGQDVTFNLNGISEASQLDKVLIDTRTGIDGDFGKITVGGFNGTVDYLTVNTRKSDDQKQYLASYGLSWTAGNNLAHGTFTLASLTDVFDVGVALADQAANPATGWNGKALTKTGLGTLVLSADNTYSGGTTIADGTLQLGNGGNTGSIVGDVLNHGALAFNRNDSLTFTGAISGTGQVIQMGSGTTLLSGDNNYSGGTTLAGGTLQVARDANLGDAAGGLTFTGGTLKTTDSFDTGRSMLLSRTGQFDVAAASVLGLTGKVSGSGDLLKRGEGTLRLDNAANAYGDTLVQAGTLIGNAASISGNIGNAGTLVFDQASDAGFAGNIAGLDDSKGQMVKQGAGNLTLGGHSSLDWSIRSGGLASAAERFSGNADIVSGAHLAFEQKNDAAYAGTLSGAGLFVKGGSGALLLKEDSAGFTGLTRVEDGKLVVNGKLGGSMQVLAGSTLAGSGTIGSGAGSTVTIAESASLSPGNSIGTLKVDGDLVFQKGSRFVVEVDPDSKDSDLVHVSGNTVLDGGTVAHIGATGNYKLRSTYTILASDKGLGGTFDEVTSDFAFLDPKLLYNYDLGTVDLSFTRKDRAFASVAMTRNQTATANAIDSMGFDAGHAVYDAVAQLPDDHDLIRGSFDQLSGEIHASMKSALIEESHIVRDAATDRLRAAFGDVAAASSPVIAYEDGQQQLVSPTTERAAAWAQGFGAWGHTDSDGNAAALKRSTKGMLVGADAPVFDTWRLGVLAGYSRTSANVAQRSSSGNSDNYHLGAYAGTRWNLPQGTLGLRTGLSHTWHQIETSRSVAFPGFSDKLKDDYRAGTLQAFGDLGYRIDMPSVSLEPFVNLAHTRQRSKGFSERGGAAALHGKAQSTDTTFTTLGLRASTKLDVAGIETTARGSLGWRHALGDTTPLSTHAFSAGNAFTVAGAPLAKNAALVEVGADVAITPSTSLGLSYDGQFTGSTRQHGLKASLSIRF